MDESRFLEQYDIHRFDVPLTTIDVVCFSLVGESLHVLLARRAHMPFHGAWALPGGFIDLAGDRNLGDTVVRKVAAKTGIRISYLEQVETIGNADRDPRGWSVTCLYLSLLDPQSREDQQIEQKRETRWVALEDLDTCELAFDHDLLVEKAVARLRSKARYSSLPLHLLAETFTLQQAQRVFELVLGTCLEKKSFRRRLGEAAILEETGETLATRTRGAALYRLRPDHREHLFPRTIG